MIDQAGAEGDRTGDLAFEGDQGLLAAVGPVQEGEESLRLLLGQGKARVGKAAALGDRQVFLVEGEDLRLEFILFSIDEQPAIHFRDPGKTGEELAQHPLVLKNRKLRPEGNLGRVGHYEFNGGIMFLQRQAADQDGKGSGGELCHVWSLTLVPALQAGGVWPVDPDTTQ